MGAKGLVCAAVLVTTGCGTMFNTKPKRIHLSGPPGATVFVDGVAVGTSPIDVDLDQRKSHKVVFQTASGDVACKVARKVSLLWALVNVPVYGQIIDLLTKRIFTLS